MGAGIDIIPFDAETASPRQWSSLHVFRRIRHEEANPEDPLEDDVVVETWMRSPEPQVEELRFAAMRSDNPDEMIGFLSFRVYREDSPSYEERKEMSWVGLEVLQPYRRQRIGTQLLRKATELASETGKTVMVFDSDEEDGKAFLKAIGSKIAQRTRESRLYLDQVDWDMVRQWAAEGQKRSPTSMLRFYEDRIDDDIIEGYCRVLTEVINQAPRDDLDLGDITTTPETVRAWETKALEVGGTQITAVAIEADGEVSGLTAVGHFPDQATIVRQFMTGVRDMHRGRGLGKWLKAAMLLRVLERFPQAEVIVTGNATSNAAMLSINVRLGFRPP